MVQLVNLLNDTCSGVSIPKYLWIRSSYLSMLNCLPIKFFSSVCIYLCLNKFDSSFLLLHTQETYEFIFFIVIIHPPYLSCGYCLCLLFIQTTTKYVQHLNSSTHTIIIQVCADCSIKLLKDPTLTSQQITKWKTLLENKVLLSFSTHFTCRTSTNYLQEFRTVYILERTQGLIVAFPMPSYNYSYNSIMLICIEIT